MADEITGVIERNGRTLCLESVIETTRGWKDIPVVKASYTPGACDTDYESAASVLQSSVSDFNDKVIVKELMTFSGPSRHGTSGDSLREVTHVFSFAG